MEQKDYFIYNESATDYLKSRDKRLAEVIDRVGKIERELGAIEGITDPAPQTKKVSQTKKK